jgi:hypothetical protein
MPVSIRVTYLIEFAFAREGGSITHLTWHDYYIKELVRFEC